MLFLAALLSAIGVAVYALDRGGSVHFLAGWSNAPAIPVFGPLAAFLPTFLHTLVFILITAVILRPWPRTLPATCCAWFLFECLFEVGQMEPIDGYIAGAVPRLRVITSYFTQGTYDPLDVLSIGVGAVIAYLVARMVLRGDKQWIQDNPDPRSGV